ncbi:DMT family transporter [Zoogloea sp.]|uniref:DMT family transporter n=1 Tax=Zoogloea sp. TaxID=49181 RepID=UPI0026316A93|nr:DMT family transporter [Zoogloea sp.]MDD3352042.1 DMT family transporter [Zoogloea sp.]
MPHPSPHSLKADLLLAFSTLLAAAGWLFSKEALAGLPPLLFMGLRFLAAGSLLCLAARKPLRQLGWQGIGHGLRVGALFTLAIGLWILGLAHSSHMGEGAFITSLGVVLVPVYARIFFGDRPPVSTWLALPVALTGFALLALQHGFKVEAGQVLFFASALVFALLFNVNSRVVRQVPVLALSALQVIMVGIVLLPVSALTERWPEEISTPILGWLMASALIATTARFLCQLYGQSLTTPSHAALILMLEPMLTAIAAALWYGETMSTQQVAGCSLIFVALIMSRWTWIRALLKGAG